MRRLAPGFVAFGTAALMASAVRAQTPPATAQQPAPPPLTNLQLYPKDIARPELIATM